MQKSGIILYCIKVLRKKQMQKKAKNITIIAHRGFWKQESEKNSQIAFERAFDLGYGVETDLRDIKGNIVVSHNMPCGHEITFESLLQLMNGRNLPLALNIKADGMSKEIKKLLNKYKQTNYFTFDMSIPEMVVQRDEKLIFFTGLSDLIKEPILFDDADGIWLDSFYEDWFDSSIVKNLIARDKKVCIVSPDLHHRKYQEVWEKYKNIEGIMICTDYPKEAEVFFNGKD